MHLIPIPPHSHSQVWVSFPFPWDSHKAIHILIPFPNTKTLLGRPCLDLIPRAGHLFRYVTNQPPKTNSAFHPSGVGKWVPAPAGKAKAGMVHSISGWTRGVQVKVWNPLRTRRPTIPERLRDVFTTRRYSNPPLPYLTLPYLRHGVVWRHSRVRLT